MNIIGDNPPWLALLVRGLGLTKATVNEGEADQGDGFVTLRETETFMKTVEKLQGQKPSFFSVRGASSLLDLQLFKNTQR